MCNNIWSPELDYDVSTGDCQWEKNGVPIKTYWSIENNKLWFEVCHDNIIDEHEELYKEANEACKNFGVRFCDNVEYANELMKQFGVYDDICSCFYEDEIMGICG